MKYKVITKSSAQTKKLAGDLAKKILELSRQKKAVIIGLTGNLGSGKTTFLQGFAKSLGIGEKILSPTFVILKRFPIKRKNRATVVVRPSSQRIEGCGFKNFYHIDCYRIQRPRELLELGFKEVISDSKNIVAIEWVERIEKILPPKTIFVKFKFIDKNKRKISMFNTRR